MNTISEQYKINIVLDRAVIQQMGFEPDGMQVELNMKEGKLAERPSRQSSASTT